MISGTMGSSNIGNMGRLACQRLSLVEKGHTEKLMPAGRKSRIESVEMSNDSQ